MIPLARILGRLQLSAARAVLAGALRVTPTTASICVNGWPDEEENALWMALTLANSTRARVTLLAQNPDAARGYLSTLGHVGEKLPTVLRTRSWQGLVAALRARAWVFTHGMYGRPNVTRRRVFLNLWHGSGPKRTENSSFRHLVPSDTLIACSGTWGVALADSIQVPRDRLFVSSHPRQDAFATPASDDVLRRLNLDPSKPIALWMPTYRQATSGAKSWSDSPAVTSRGGDEIGQVVKCAAAAGVQLVVKAHPLDADRYASPGLVSLSSANIWAAGCTPYQLLARADALISDYSSVWVEFLTLDRSLALYCPDLDDYVRSRGFNHPSMVDLARDLIVRRPEDLAQFFNAVAVGDGTWRPDARKAILGDLEVATNQNAADEVLRKLRLDARRKHIRLH
jgi:CDP-glycerol glycerophosphotransferase